MLEVIVACLYLVNKILLSLEKSAGWLIGALASSLAILYFISLELYLFITLEAGFLLLLVYGWFGRHKSLGLDQYAYLLILAVLGIQYYWIEESRPIELVDTFAFMVAIYALGKHRWYIGWLLMLLAHLLMGIISYEKSQHFFLAMQIGSMLVAAYAIGRRWVLRKEE